MANDDPVRRTQAHERQVGDPTPGIVREQAIAVDGMWAGFVRNDPHMASGWHHHGNHDTALYVLKGAVRLEFGPGGRDAVEAGTGDFLHVPKYAIHREVNPQDEHSHVVVVRAGDGAPTVNVDGPAPG
jgi:uncharacterized RmlC-like cupin family protein